MALVPDKYLFIKESNGNVTLETYKGVDLLGTASLNPAKDIRISESYPGSIIIPLNTTGNHIDNKFVSIPWERIDFVNSTPANVAPTDINGAVNILGEDFFFDVGGSGGDTYWEVADIGGTDFLQNIDQSFAESFKVKKEDFGLGLSAEMVIELDAQLLRISAQNGSNFATVSLLGSGNVQLQFTKTLICSQFPEYADDAAADADVLLDQGGLYKLTGDRTVYQKP